MLPPGCFVWVSLRPYVDVSACMCPCTAAATAAATAATAAAAAAGASARSNLASQEAAPPRICHAAVGVDVCLAAIDDTNVTEA